MSKEQSSHPETLQPPPYYPYPENSEDEINLLDLFLVLLKYKKMIFWLVVITGILAVVYSLRLPNIYRSEATIVQRDDSGRAIPSISGFGELIASQAIGVSGNLAKLQIILASRQLAELVIKKHDLMPILFPDIWDQEKKTWKEDVKHPTIQDGINNISNLFTTNLDKKNGTLSIAILHKDPKTAKTMVEYYLNELSTTLREEILSDATDNIRFFNEQINKTSDSLLKEKLYSMLAKEIERVTFARNQKNYGFLIIDPPIVPDLNKKYKPKRSLICILSVIVSFMMAIFLAFLLEFVKKTKTDDPDRYSEILKGIKIRS